MVLVPAVYYLLTHDTLRLQNSTPLVIVSDLLLMNVPFRIDPRVNLFGMVSKGVFE